MSKNIEPKSIFSWSSERGLQLHPPTDGKVSIVEFIIGKPSPDCFPLYISINGEPPRFLCELRPQFCNLTSIRNWMEEAVEYSPTCACHQSCQICINCGTYFTYLLTSHAGWDKRRHRIIIFEVLRHGNEDPIVHVFCDANRTISNFYSTLTSAVRRNSRFLDQHGNWTICEPYAARHKTSEQLLRQISSARLETLCNLEYGSMARIKKIR